MTVLAASVLLAGLLQCCITSDSSQHVAHDRMAASPPRLCARSGSWCTAQCTWCYVPGFFKVWVCGSVTPETSEADKAPVLGCPQDVLQMIKKRLWVAMTSGLGFTYRCETSPTTQYCRVVDGKEKRWVDSCEIC